MQITEQVVHWARAYLLLVFGVSRYQPLSAEAVETFGPMHIPIVTKGYENRFVTLVKRKRVMQFCRLH